MVVNLDIGSGDTVHLTLLSDEEYQVLKAEVEQAQAEAAQEHVHKLFDGVIFAFNKCLALCLEVRDSKINKYKAAAEEEAAIEAETAPVVESQANAYESEIEPEYQLQHQQVL